MNLQELIDASQHRSIAYTSLLEGVKAFRKKGDEVAFCSFAFIPQLELRKGLEVDKYKRASEQKVLEIAREVDETLNHMLLHPGPSPIYLQFLIEHAMELETEYVSKLVEEKEN